MAIRLGVVGCGKVTTTYHLPALRAVPEFTVTALCDISDSATRDADLEFGLRADRVRDPAELTGKVDAALVAVSPRFHATIGAQLLEAGVHVLCEKPLAATADDAERMVAAARASHRILMVGLPFRFHPNNKILLDLIGDGVLGDIRAVSVEYGTRLSWGMSSDAYYNRATTAGGVFYDTGVHAIDRTLSLFGPLRDIGYQDDSYGGVEANAILSGRLHVGGADVPLSMAFSWTHSLSNAIRVVGAVGAAEARVADPDSIIVYKRFGSDDLRLQVQRKTRSGSRNSLRFFREIWREFAAAIGEGREPAVTGESAIGALRLIEQAYAVRTPLPQPWVEPQAFAL